MRREMAAFIRSARDRGVAATMELLASEYLFDLRYGTETHRVLERHQLGHLERGVCGADLTYHAVNPRIFRRALDTLRDRLNIDVRDGSFVDFGSGKGRALILAAEHGFPKVIGVECSQLLHERCKRNLRRAWTRRRLRAEYELHCQDAATFCVPDDSTVWFWFNPFDGDVARRTAAHMIESLRRRSRRAHLLYANPVHADVLLRQGFSIVGEAGASTRHVDVLILQVGVARAT